MHTCVYVCVCICICVYMYINREGERHVYVCVCIGVCMYMCIGNTYINVVDFAEKKSGNPLWT